MGKKNREERMKKGHNEMKKKTKKRARKERTKPPFRTYLGSRRSAHRLIPEFKIEKSRFTPLTAAAILSFKYSSHDSSIEFVRNGRSKVPPLGGNRVLSCGRESLGSHWVRERDAASTCVSEYVCVFVRSDSCSCCEVVKTDVRFASCSFAGIVLIPAGCSLGINPRGTFQES